MPPYTTWYIALIQLAPGVFQPAWWNPNGRPVLHQSPSAALTMMAQADGYGEPDRVRECRAYPDGRLYIPDLGVNWQDEDFRRMRLVTA